jgi:hypothetical protein
MLEQTKVSNTPLQKATAEAAQPIAAWHKLKTLQSAVPFSECLLWKLQRRFYESQGKAAWANGLLPYQITSNPFIAEVYARLIESFLDDCRRSSGQQAPRVRIVELGAGHGVFSCALLRELECDGLLPEVDYLMTDASATNVNQWAADPRLQSFAEQGVLSYAQWVIGDSGIDALQRADPGHTGPLVVIANYVFDSIAQDIFVVERGELHEMLVTVTAPSHLNVDPDAPPDDLFPSLDLQYSRAPVAPGRYVNPLLNEILAEYGDTLPAATVLFPAKALQAIADLRTLGGGDLLLLSADKGYIDDWDLAHAPGPPAIEHHAGNAFSLMVNYDAIAKFCRRTGGESFLPTIRPHALAVGAFAWKADKSVAGLRRAFRTSVGTFGPDELYIALEALSRADRLSLAQIVAVIRLSRYSASLLLRLADTLLPLLDGLSDIARDELRLVILETWNRTLPLGPPEEDLAFRCGTLLLNLRFYPDAIALLEASTRQYGTAPATAYNLGLCHAATDRDELALAAFREACELDPAFEESRSQIVALTSRKQFRTSLPQSSCSWPARHPG